MAQETAVDAARPGVGGDAQEFTSPGRRTRRAVLGAGAAVGAGAFAAACGAGGQPGAGEGAAAAAPTGTATYLFHGGQGWELDQYLELGKRFRERHPAMQVDVTFGQGSYLTKLQAMVSAGDPPDATFMANWYIPEYAERGLLRSLGPLLSRDKIDLKRFFDSTVALCRWKVQGTEQVFALPRHPSPLVLYYNKALLERRAQKAPDGTWTWDTLLEAARKLTGDEWGVNPPYSIPYSLFTYVRAMGGDVLDKDWKRFTLDQPVATTAVQWVADLAVKQRVAPPYGDTTQTFVQSRVAMTTDIYPFISTVQTQGQGQISFDVAPLPKGPRGRVNRNVAGTYPLLNGAKNPEVGWEWLKFLVTKEAMLLLAGSGVIIPALREAAQAPEFVSPPAPAPVLNRKVFLDALENDVQVSEPLLPASAEIEALIKTTLEPVWKGETDARSALQPIAQQVNSLIAPR
jgi:multiple sugar transport system substrate-binding protein